MRKFVESHYKNFTDVIDSVDATDKRGWGLDIYAAIETVCDAVRKKSDRGGKIFLIGNGGSASIASHLAADFLKNAKIPALALNDPSLITCISNDLGYEYVFEKPLDMLSTAGDVLFAISSSGRSKNILHAVAKAGEKKCLIVSLSGFDRDNPLRKSGDFNFYLSSNSYGCVEIAHLVICHCIVDKIIENKKQNG